MKHLQVTFPSEITQSSSLDNLFLDASMLQNVLNCGAMQYFAVDKIVEKLQIESFVTQSNPKLLLMSKYKTESEVSTIKNRELFQTIQDYSRLFKTTFCSLLVERDVCFDPRWNLNEQRKWPRDTSDCLLKLIQQLLIQMRLNFFKLTFAKSL